MLNYFVKESVRLEIIKVLSAKLKVNDTAALILSMSGMLVAVLAVS
jgi:hypothetical protein